MHFRRGVDVTPTTESWPRNPAAAGPARAASTLGEATVAHGTLRIVEEAGGRLTDLDGHDSLTSDTALATNGRLHEAALKALAAA